MYFFADSAGESIKAYDDSKLIMKETKKSNNQVLFYRLWWRAYQGISWHQMDHAEKHQKSNNHLFDGVW